MYTFKYNGQLYDFTAEELNDIVNGHEKRKGQYKFRLAEYLKSLALTSEEVQNWVDRENYILIIAGKKIDLTKLYRRIINSLPSLKRKQELEPIKMTLSEDQVHKLLKPFYDDWVAGKLKTPKK